MGVTPMPLFVFPFPTSTTLRVLVKLSAVPSNKELFAPEMSSVTWDLASPTRRCSPSNNTRRFLNPPDQETLSVCPSRVLPRTRRSTQVTSSTLRRKEPSPPSHLSPPWLQSKSTLVF